MLGNSNNDPSNLFCSTVFQINAQWLCMSRRADTVTAVKRLMYLWDGYGPWIIKLNIPPSQACGVWDAEVCPWLWLDYAKATRHTQIHRRSAQTVWVRVYVKWPHQSLWSLYSLLESPEATNARPGMSTFILILPQYNPETQPLDQSIHSDFERAVL